MIKFTQKTEECSEVKDSLTLPWSHRIKSRQRVHLDNGKEAGLFLERGTVLRDGDCLKSDNGEVVTVRAALETVSTLICRDSLQLARICYHLGNRHVDLEISETMLRYPHDHVLDDMIRGLGFEIRVEEAVFEPETGAYGQLPEGHRHHHG